MRYSEIQKEIQKRFDDEGIPDAAADARFLIMYATGFGYAELMLHMQEEISEAELESLNAYVKRRCNREPLQYIIGTQDFMGYTFKCTPACLIPRLDTEVLAEMVTEYIKTLDFEPDVLDMCTGTGCIITSLAGLCKLNSATGSDISEEALKIAKENAELNKQKVSFIRSDLFDNISGKFDVITANPPYIRSDVIPGLMPEVKSFEPMLALDGGEDGLMLYRCIAVEAAEHLKTGGRLYLEIGDDQGEAVRELLVMNGYKDVRICRDLAGLDRIAVAVKP